MRLRIQHTTTYNFSERVFLEPHYLRFRPRESQQLRLQSFNMSVQPEPAGHSTRLDAFNTMTDQVFFNDLHEKLVIHVELEVQTIDFNPFNYLYHPAQPILSIDYGAYTEFLIPYLQAERVSESCLKDVRQMAMDAGMNITVFLSNVLAYFYENWKHEIVTSEELTNPETTFHSRSGSCRDLSWLMITLFRQLGMASRYVGGYAYNPKHNDDHELHAWMEVFVPGGGWIGLDPSLGLLITDHYVPVSNAPHPRFTLPVSGTFRGSAEAELNHEVDISELT